VADNVELNAGSGGATIATDDIGGVQYPRTKITLGADGAADGDVSSANPLPVQLASVTAVATVTAILGQALPTGTNNIGDVDATLYGGAKGATAAMVFTGTIAGADHNALDVVIRDSTGVELDYRQENENWNAADHGVLMFGRDIYSTPNKYRAIAMDSTGCIDVNLHHLNNVTLDVNNGAVSSGTLRVTIANNGTGVLASVGTVSSIVNVQMVAQVTTCSHVLHVVPGWLEDDLGKKRAATVGATDVGVAILGQHLATATTTSVEEGDYDIPSMTSLSELRTLAKLTFGAAGTQTYVETTVGLPVQQQTGATWNVIDKPTTTGGLAMYQKVAAASANTTVVKNNAGQVYAIQAFNLNAAARYMKLYDADQIIAVSSATIKKTLMIPGSTSGAGVVLNWDKGLAFTSGISFAITTGIQDNDLSSVASEEIVVNVDYK
jgi:hypothetical protein